MLKKNYITIEKIKSKLKSNTIVIINLEKELKQIIKLSKENKYNIKSIQLNSILLNDEEISKEIKDNFKYISIKLNSKIKNKISNQSNFLEIITNYNYYKANKNEIINLQPNRIIIDFKENNKTSNNISKKEVIEILNNILLNKIYPLTKNLNLDNTLAEHTYEIFNKSISKDDVNNSKLNKNSKNEIIKFLEDENEGIIDRI